MHMSAIMVRDIVMIVDKS